MSVAFIALVAGSAIPVVGVDQEALLDRMPPSGWLAALGLSLPAIPVLGAVVPNLLLVQLVLFSFGWTERPRARLVGLAVYLVLTLVNAYAIALWLESFDSDMGYVLALEPGFSFRAMIVLPELAGAAVLWWISDRITRSGAAHGALAIALVHAVIQAPANGFEVGATETIDPMWIVDAAAEAIAPLALGVVIALRPPDAWPVRLWKTAALRSWIDLVGLAIAAAAVVSMPVIAVVNMLLYRGALEPEISPIVSVAMTVAIVGALAVLWSLRTRDARGLPQYASACVGALILTLAMAGGSLASAAGRADPSRPLAGDAAFDITLAADDRFEDGEAEAMVQTIEALGASAEIARRSSERITLRVEDATRDSEAILDALAPHTLELYLVASCGEASNPDTGTIVGTCDSIVAGDTFLTYESFVQRLPAEDGDSEAMCELFCVDPDPVVTSTDVEDADVGLDENGAPIVLVSLGRVAADFMWRFSGENIGERLVIVYDGEVQIAPRIQSRMGERIQITFGSYRPYRELLSEAENVALALGSSTRIESTWSVERVVSR